MCKEKTSKNDRVYVHEGDNVIKVYELVAMGRVYIYSFKVPNGNAVEALLADIN